jgi:hypothetical protein
MARQPGVRRGGEETGGTYVWVPCVGVWVWVPLVCGRGHTVPRRAWAGGAALSGASERAGGRARLQERSAGSKPASTWERKGKPSQARQGSSERESRQASKQAGRHAVCRRRSTVGRQWRAVVEAPEERGKEEEDWLSLLAY